MSAMRMVCAATAALGLAACGPGGVADQDPPVTTATPPGGTFTAPVDVTLACADAGAGCAAIHYTLDGSAPTMASPVATGPIAVDKTATLRFFAVDAAGNAEEPRSAAFVLDREPPAVAAIPPGGAFASPQAVILTCSDGGGSGCAELRYTLDGTPPDRSALRYVAPIPVETEATIRFVAWDGAGNASPPGEARVLVDGTPPASVATPPGGAFPDTVTVALACADAGAGCLEVRCSLDPGLPPEVFPACPSPAVVDATATLRLYGVDVAGNAEPVHSERYLVDRAPPAVTADPPGGAFPAAVTVALRCDDGPAGSGCAAIHITADGSASTLDSPVYAGTIAIVSGATLRFLAVDAVGNASAQSTATYLVDPVAPTVRADPPGGRYCAAQPVALSCDDGAGSGCGPIRYTLDGTAPTDVSPEYTGPVEVAADATIRFFARDRAGNASAPGVEAYVVDAIPPEVLAVAPADGARRVPVDTVVQVTFSEPVDATSVAGGLSLALAGTAVPGAVALSPDGRTATLAPAAPLLSGVTYTLQVAGVRDLAGNVLADAGASFTTAPARVELSGRTSATISSEAVAYDAAGNALVVWTSDTGTSRRLRYAWRSAESGTWSAEGSLGVPLVGITEPATVAGGASGFLVVWADYTATWAARISGGVANAPEKLLPRRLTSIAVAASGAGYAVAGTDYNDLNALVLEGGAWQPVFRATTYPDQPSTPALASDGTGYVLAYELLNPGRLLVRRYLGAGAWSGATTLWSTYQYSLGRVRAASNGASCALAADGPSAAVGSTDLRVFVDDGTTFTSSTVATAYALIATGIASDGSGYGVTWDAYGGNAFHARAAVQQAGSWSPAQPIEPPGLTASNASIASDGLGYAVLAPVYDGIFNGYDLYAAGSTAGTWTPVAPLEADAAPAGMPHLAGHPGGTLAVWHQDDGAVHQVLARPLEGGVPAEPASGLVRVSDGSSAAGVRLVQNDSGEVLAAWQQPDRGQVRVFVARRAPGAPWSAPVALATGSSPAVATDGSGFLVAWADTISSARGIYAMTLEGGAWSPMVKVYGDVGYGGKLAAASDRTGYALAWAESSDVYAAVRAGGAWGTAAKVSTVTGTAYELTAAARAGVYGFAWRQLPGTTGAASAYGARALGSAGTWTFEPAVALEGSSMTVTAGPRLVTFQGGFAAAWTQGGQAYATLHDGIAWTAPALLHTATIACYAPALAAGDGKLMAAFQCHGPVLAALNDGTAWGPALAVGDSPPGSAVAPEGRTVALAAQGAGFSLLAIGSDGGLRAARFSQGAWSSPLRMDRGGPVRGDLALLPDADGLTAAWCEPSTADAAADQLLAGPVP